MKRKWKRVVSCFLVFAIVVTMGIPVQAQTAGLDESMGISVEQTEPAAEETGSDEAKSSKEPAGEPAAENAQESEKEPVAEDTKEPEKETVSENAQEPEKETVSENAQEPEKETVSENAQEPEEKTVSENSSNERLRKERMADGDVLTFKEDEPYAIVASSIKCAMNVVKVGWGTPIKVAADYYASDSKITDANAQFYITSGYDKNNSDVVAGEGEVKVKIECMFEGKKYAFRTEAKDDPNELNYPFADDRYDGKQETYLIKKTGENEGIIWAVLRNRYAVVNNGEVRFSAEKAEDAERFMFVENPEILNTTISIEHKKSGKYIKTYQDDGKPLTVDGNKGDAATVFSKAVFGTNKTDTVDGLVFTTVSLISKEYGNGVGSVFWAGGQSVGEVKTANGKTGGGGWETVRILGNGDGTVSFKDSCFDQYITVKDGKLVGGELSREMAKEDLSDNEKFILHTEVPPLAASDLSFDSSSRTQTTIDLSWTNPQSLFTGIEVWQKKENESDDAYKKAGEAGSEEKYTVTGLEKNTGYTFKIRPVLKNGGGQELYADFSDPVTAATRLLAKPETPQNVRIESVGDSVKISWDKVDDITGYKVLRAPSRFGKYEDEAASAAADATEIVIRPEGDKYSNYYRVVAMRDDERSDESGFVSLETELFGDHTVIFAETDDVAEIDKYLKELFDRQNDYNADAQFKGEQWQVYFKPGDYTETSCMYLGFYTSFSGLGKTPYDVKLNNIAIPAYLPAGALGGSGDNATCNFWRSTENVSIINTGNSQGKAGFGSYRPEWFNWAVAQAAPLRRVYSERPVAYDWNYGWASGGYVADCLMEGVDGEGNSAGTWSGQQFFTRNSKVKANTFGTTLNNFFMGVEAANNLDGTTGKELKNGNGYTNWGIAGAANSAGLGGQQVVTEITNTPKISEKPFLYLDGGEYKIFVPAVRENARGISWSKESMGEGKSLSLLDDFYIARPTDTAAKINREIAGGKNIYFTPGIYHAETPIVVDRANTILLGTGMASIIPDNGDTAMRVGDKDGIRIEGLIFDAGESSKLLLQVGTEGTHTNHSANPIVLQDLFFRVGGTTDVLTKADDALEINSDDVIGDHFWIWRADHGAGVEWYGNESKHGLIVNGDRVKCYALFNEHFQEYHTLWNGEDGATYFYQNETCYDPISQEAWMSHNGTVKGYSSYKVSNDVNNHYAVGLGVYNVFIYTGKTYDGLGIGIQLDNAIEVPNKPGVMVENACTQTFANDEKEGGGFYPLSKINHIVNGIGGAVSSGMSDDLVRGEGWSRKFVLYYHNGEAEFGKEPDRKTFNFENEVDSDQRGKFVGTEVVKVEQPADEEIYLDRIMSLFNQFSDKSESDYTAQSWKNADMSNVLANAQDAIDKGRKVVSDIEAGKNYSQPEISAIQTQINKACTTLEAASEKLVYIGRASWQRDKYKDYKEENYTAQSWKIFADARNQLDNVLEKANRVNPTAVKDIYLLQTEIDNACSALEEAAANLAAVKTIHVTGVVLNRSSVSLRKGNTITLMAATQPGDATDQKVTWSSSDTKTAAVDDSGNVTAVSVGTATITVKTNDGGFTADCQVTVTAAEEIDVITVREVRLDQTSLVLKKGGSSRLTATVVPDNATNPAVTWNSSNPDAVTVDENGTVTAVETGTADVTVRTVDGGHTAICKVSVEDSGSATDPENPDGPKEPDTPDTPDNPDEPEEEQYMTLYADDGQNQDIYIENYPVRGYEYTGKAIKPVVSVDLLSENGEPLKLKKDYTVSYKKNVNVGNDTAIITIKGKGKNKKTVGTHTIKFTVCPARLSGKYEISAIKPLEYNGKERKAAAKVKLLSGIDYKGKKTLKSKKDFTVSYENNTDAGEAAVIVTGTKNYTGELKVSFTIEQKSVKKGISVAKIPNQAADGTPKCPELTVKFGKNVLEEGRDYTAEYKNNVEPGKATVEITGHGNYKDTLVKTFTIK